MTLQTTLGHTVTVGEDSEDLREWLRRQHDCPAIELTALLSCANPAHGTEHPTWFFVEADPAAGVARRRCVGCAAEQSMLDSADHWTYPAMYACTTCGQSMVELAAGLHLADEDSPGLDQRASWVVLGCRCVACGRIDGLTDFVVAPTPVEELVARL